MIEEEVEIEEKTVERVYCDECSNECTDDHKIAPSHLCSSCAEGRSTYETLAEFRDNLSFEDIDVTNTLGAVIGAFIMPCMLLLLIVDASELNANDLRTIFMFVSGSVLWTVVTLLILL